MAEKGYIWVDSDKLFAEMCEKLPWSKRHWGEVKEVDPVGVHDVAEEFRERRAEPAIEEQREERVSSRS